MLRQKYGITLEDYDRMVEDQGSVCAICRKPEISIDSRRGLTRLLAVDHCHETGQVRALLCHACNQALGMLKEDPDLMQKMKEYAEWCQSLKASASS